MTRPDNTPRRKLWRGVLLFIPLLLAICQSGLVLLELLGEQKPVSEGRSPRVPASKEPQSPIGASAPTAASALVEGRPKESPRPVNPTAHPPSAPTSPGLRFNGHMFGFDPDAAAALARHQHLLDDGGSDLVLLGLTARAERTVRSDLAAQGVDLLDYVPDNGWIARLHPNREASPLPGIFSVQPLTPSLRVHAGLHALASRHGDVPVYVHAVRDRPVTDLAATLAAAGFESLAPLSVGNRAHLAGTIAAHRLPDFLRLAATHRDVQWIEPGGRARLANDSARRITQSGHALGTIPFHDRDIYGTDQVIAICDTGLDIDSCYFRDARATWPAINSIAGTATDWTARKVIAVNFLDPTDDPNNPLAWDNHGHGTAVAGCAAGSPLGAPWDISADNGMAPGARLIIQDAGFDAGNNCADLPGLGCPVTNFYPVLQQAVAQGATIHNNSWGDQEQSLIQNIYSQVCRELDLVTWSNRHFLVVCAAGNNALDDTVGSPSTAKNCLSVAASMSGSNQERVAGFSSRGWASDGRYKPDLTAPGQDIRTAASDGDTTTQNCYRTTRSGTSFSTPIVAGLAALARDYFAQGFYPTGNPVMADRRLDLSAALVKAVLINAAVSMSNALASPPTRDQGWGRVNLSRTLPLHPNTFALRVVDQSPAFAETPAFPYRKHVRLTSTDQPIRITLVWTDYPATPGADRHLVNDLDLRMRTPRHSFRGNHRVDGQSVPGGAFDRLNNVEQIHWTPDRTGVVEISVWAHRIVVGPQDFALVIAGPFEEVSTLTDTDQDGLPDYWEQWHFDNLEPLPGNDDDADGIANRDEMAAGTDPNDPHSQAHLQFVSLHGGTATLEINVTEALQYTLERSAGPWPFTAWSPVSAPVLVGEPVGETRVRFTDCPPAGQEAPVQHYYRVRIMAPP